MYEHTLMLNENVMGLINENIIHRINFQLVRWFQVTFFVCVLVLLQVQFLTDSLNVSCFNCFLRRANAVLLANVVFKIKL